MVDFIYFVFTSINPELVINNWDALISYYHDELSTSMSDLKVQTQPPSVEQLKLQVQRAGPFGELGMLKLGKRKELIW